MDRIATLHFNDGSKLSFDFPEQIANAAGKQLRLADFMASKHVVVEAEGQVFVFPVGSIKYIALSVPTRSKETLGALPRHAITGARVRA
ncbi:MAG TPA: hypothetical protein VFE23_18705 [Usitatibacter sp.]|jgi:hypothetical protein|nr:hypothetical protein [Usitatibacter sp.]